jgi:hypothetical protein
VGGSPCLPNPYSLPNPNPVNVRDAISMLLFYMRNENKELIPLIKAQQFTLTQQ